MNIIKTAILGYAIADAMGVYNEFKLRKDNIEAMCEEFREKF